MEAGQIMDLTTQERRSTEAAGGLSEPGRVYEVRATIVHADGSDLVTIDECRSLREHHTVRALQQREGVEVVLQPYDVYLRHKMPGLAVFDMDSTLIQQEVIDELARAAGRYEQVAAVTEAAMRGEIDFEESLKGRVEQLKRVHKDIFDHLRKEVITISPGARELIKVLKHFGWRTAVLSGGFTNLAYWLRDTLELDHASANVLAIDNDGKLTGELVSGSPIVHAEAKRDTLVQLAAENQIPIENTIAVGDGSNDLLMMEASGFGIAFNAKPKVQAAAPARLNTSSLQDILYLLGYTKEEQMSALG